MKNKLSNTARAILSLLNKTYTMTMLNLLTPQTCSTFRRTVMYTYRHQFSITATDTTRNAVDISLAFNANFKQVFNHHSTTALASQAATFTGQINSICMSHSAILNKRLWLMCSCIQPWNRYNKHNHKTQVTKANWIYSDHTITNMQMSVTNQISNGEFMLTEACKATKSTTDHDQKSSYQCTFILCREKSKPNTMYHRNVNVSYPNSLHLILKYAVKYAQDFIRKYCMIAEMSIFKYWW